MGLLPHNIRKVQGADSLHPLMYFYWGGVAEKALHKLKEIKTTI
jgi:hypothetical protein